MPTRYLFRFLLVCHSLVLAALAGCGTGAVEDASPPQSLTVFAAASLTDAFREIALVWETENPDIDLVFNFAGSNQLATQINQGAPADVFASADWEQMDRAVAGGRIDVGAPRVLATNRLAVVFPADNPAGITRLQDLAAPDTLIVLAAGQVPVGRYSLDFLEKAGNDSVFGEQFQENVLGNVVSYEENVRAVLNKVALGEADAGIVYVSDLVDVVGVGRLDIPDHLNSVAEYPIAALNDSPHAAAAAAFIDLAFGPAGQAVFAQHGFGPGLTP